ncbi:MAG: DUF4105 domain-containing protein [Bacteroidales bacterium]|jgi:hypothetical protein|nr:DUF4105 domain-containing protein [Bacteroidales bacterium]
MSQPFFSKRHFISLMISGCMTVSAQLSGRDNLTVSLLTVDPGEELYASFEHSALRVKDSLEGHDWVFNYGMFDFNAPGFYANFARGRMDYILGVQRYEHFLNIYAVEGRAIYEQVLLLDSLQKKFITDFLYNNARPENRHYRYHFFLDNCATRIRDLVEQTFDNIEWPPSAQSPTYRELVYDCTRNHPWGRFAIDIALGLPTDQKTGTWEQMFLPGYLAKAFAQATSNGQPIAGEMHPALIPADPLVVRPSAVTPMMVGCLLLALALLFCFVQKGARIFDFTLFFVTGWTGVLVCFLWFFTDHTNTHGNLNLIWALPTHTVMAFFLLSKKHNGFVRKYFLATAVISVLLLASRTFLPQHMNTALIPVHIALALRAFLTSRTLSVDQQPK